MTRHTFRVKRISAKIVSTFFGNVGRIGARETSLAVFRGILHRMTIADITWDQREMHLFAPVVTPQIPL